MTEREMNMGLEYSIVANKPVEASVSWVKSGGEGSVALNAGAKDIVVAMAMMFRTILEAEKEQGIPNRMISLTVLKAMKQELFRAENEGMTGK